VCLGIVGPERDRARVALLLLGMAPQEMEHGSPVEVRFRVPRIEADCRVVAGQGVFRDGRAPAAPRPGCGAHRGSPAAIGPPRRNRPVLLVRRRPDSAATEVGAGFGMARVHSDRDGQQRGGVLCVPGPDRDHAQQVQGIEVVRGLFDDRAAQRTGLRKVAAAECVEACAADSAGGSRASSRPPKWRRRSRRMLMGACGRLLRAVIVTLISSAT